MPDVVLNTKHPGTESLNAIRYWSDDKFALKEDKIASSFIVRLSFDPEFIGQTWTLSGGDEIYTGIVKSTPDNVSVVGIDEDLKPITYKLIMQVNGVEEVVKYLFFRTDTLSHPFGMLTVHLTSDDLSPYVKNNLVIYYDAINNTGDGHDDSTTTWADLSGNNNNGTIDRATWQDNALVFNGSSSNVKCGMRNYTNMSVEVYCTSDQTGININESIAGNFNSGGYELRLYNKIPRFYVAKFNNSDYYAEGKLVQPHEYNHYVGTYDGSEIKLYINGELIGKTNISGVFQTEKDNIFALGGRPDGSDVVTYFLTGKIRSVRLYDRALTSNEVINNYICETNRYK